MFLKLILSIFVLGMAIDSGDGVHSPLARVLSGIQLDLFHDGSSRHANKESGASGEEVLDSEESSGGTSSAEHESQQTYKSSLYEKESREPKKTTGDSPSAESEYPSSEYPSSEYESDESKKKTKNFKKTHRRTSGEFGNSKDKSRKPHPTHGPFGKYRCFNRGEHCDTLNSKYCCPPLRCNAWENKCEPELQARRGNKPRLFYQS